MRTIFIYMLFWSYSAITDIWQNIPLWSKSFDENLLKLIISLCHRHQWDQMRKNTKANVWVYLLYSSVWKWESGTNPDIWQCIVKCQKVHMHWRSQYFHLWPSLPTMTRGGIKQEQDTEQILEFKATAAAAAGPNREQLIHCKDNSLNLKSQSGQNTVWLLDPNTYVLLRKDVEYLHI